MNVLSSLSLFYFFRGGARWVEPLTEFTPETTDRATGIEPVTKYLTFLPIILK